MRWLIAAVATRNYRITVLVLGQALATATLERSLRTPARARRITAHLILGARTLDLAIANARPRNAPSALVALERLLGTLYLLAHVVRALLVRAVAAVRSSVAHEEPADANATRSTLERAGGAAGRAGTTTARRIFRLVGTVASVLRIAIAVRIG